MTKIEIILAVTLATYMLLSGFAIYVLREIIKKQKDKMTYYKSPKFQRELMNKRAGQIHNKNKVKGMSEL